MSEKTATHIVTSDGDFVWIEGQNHIRIQVKDTEVASPRVRDMAWNFARAVNVLIKQGVNPVSAEVRDRRKEICESNACGYFNHASVRCMRCGCFLNLKTALEAWHCPIGKW